MRIGTIAAQLCCNYTPNYAASTQKYKENGLRNNTDCAIILKSLFDLSCV